MSSNYPFVSKNIIKAQLEADPEYRKSAIVMLFQKQTEHEQATKSTLSRNRVGFMSSHSVRGSTIAQKVLAGEALTDEDWEQINKIAPRYSRQLACFMRAEAIAANPELARVAAMFSADKNLPEVATVEVETEEQF
jgi:hypothetical protein